MSQYNSLFNNTRIPMINKDILHNNSSGKHIVVMRRGHFYKVDVLDDQGTIIIFTFRLNDFYVKMLLI